MSSLRLLRHCAHAKRSSRGTMTASSIQPMSGITSGMRSMGDAPYSRAASRLTIAPHEVLEEMRAPIVGSLRRILAEHAIRPRRPIGPVGPITGWKPALLGRVKLSGLSFLRPFALVFMRLGALPAIVL